MQIFLCVCVCGSWNKFSMWRLTHCCLVTPYGDIDLVKFGSVSGLLPDGTKPVPEPMLTYHKSGRLAFTEGNVMGNALDIYPWYEFDNY